MSFLIARFIHRPLAAFAALFLLGALALPAADPVVSNVSARQVPGTKTLEVTYDLADADNAELSVYLSVSFDGGANYTRATPVTGDAGSKIAPGLGKRLLWDMSVQRNGQSGSLAYRVMANDEVAQIPAGFVLIPSGTFTIGSPDSELGRSSDEGPQHSVTISKAFYLQTSEVTWTQWNEVRTWAVANGYTDLPTGRNGYDGDGTGQHPVTEVNWYDCVKWLNAWSEREGLTPVYTVSGAVYRTGENSSVTYTPTANGYRLPTEAEWEYACRAGTTTAFYNGGITYTDCTLDAKLDAIGWYCGNSGSNTHPVKQKQANAFGLYDMSGNVWEWCWDRYGSYGSGAQSDPSGPASGSLRLHRGGSWLNPARYCRSADRNNAPPSYRNYDFLGFRPARSF